MSEPKLGPRSEHCEPDFINDQGVKWWAHSPWSNGEIWITELPTGEREYVAIRNGEIVKTGTALDAVAMQLDMLDAAERLESG